MVSIKNYITREFTVMNKKDYNRFISEGKFNYKLYTARLFKNGDVEVKGILYSNQIFHKLYTSALL